MRFSDDLLETINRWQQYPVIDEWLFENFRENLVNTMSSGEAFECINEAIELLLVQEDESTIIEVLQTIIGLARQSDTTEIPTGLLLNKRKLKDMIFDCNEYARDKLSELFRYYRI